jgi:monoamine oxidase
MSAYPLRGRSAVVIGAGLAGLTAARDLEKYGARVTVIEARARVGGRVHTVRNLFDDGQHAEAGADLIEAEQTAVLELAAAVGLKPVRILKDGFAYYGPGKSGRNRIWRSAGPWLEATTRLKSEAALYKAADESWDSGVARALGSVSAAQWLKRVRADRSFAAGVRAMRGFFLADPEQLSLLALVDQFAGGETPGQGVIYRIPGGNDMLPRKIADALRGRIFLEAVVRRVSQRDGKVTVTFDDRAGRTDLTADFAVVTSPASTTRKIDFSPRLPLEQRTAIATLRYGEATRVLLQFERPFWRRPGRARAYGTALPIGAVWDASEHQRGSTGILMLLAGGRGSAECRALLREEGPDGVVDQLRWLGRPSPLRALWHTSWEDDPMAGGGYAVFSADFAPHLRPWLRRPAGRIAFAGEHTSVKWEGFMNGAVDSGHRAAAEIAAMAAYPPPVV